MNYYSRIKEYLSEGNFSGFALALIEYDKYLHRILNEQGIYGKNSMDLLKKIKDRIVDFQGTRKAVRIRKILIEKIDHNLTTGDLEYAVSRYKKAIEDLTREGTDFRRPNILGRLKKYTKYSLFERK